MHYIIARRYAVSSHCCIVALDQAPAAASSNVESTKKFVCYTFVSPLEDLTSGSFQDLEWSAADLQ
jgi:hypothetical protein